MHLVDDAGRLRLAALTHADEDQLPELRAALEPGRGLGRAPELRARLAGLLAGAGAARAVRRAHRRRRRADDRARGHPRHAHRRAARRTARTRPEDVALIADVARRAALAVHNAQVTAAHVRVSQALQRALLPRALPSCRGWSWPPSTCPPAPAATSAATSTTSTPSTGGRSWLVAVGDVCGTGAAAAARTGLLRDVLRVLVREGGR